MKIKPCIAAFLLSLGLIAEQSLALVIHQPHVTVMLKPQKFNAKKHHESTSHYQAEPLDEKPNIIGNSDISIRVSTSAVRLQSSRAINGNQLHVHKRITDATINPNIREGVNGSQLFQSNKTESKVEMSLETPPKKALEYPMFPFFRDMVDWIFG